MAKRIQSAIVYARHGNLRTEVINRLRRRGPRRLRPQPMPMPAGHSDRRINQLLAAFPGETTYLEVGLFRGHTFEQVRATHRWGVDPRPRFDTRHLPRGVTVRACKSDEFFGSSDANRRFDVVFLDGLHTFEQTYRDLINALRVCPSGFVLIDDVVPADEVSANPDRAESHRTRARLQLPWPNMWHGDVYKVALALSEHSSQLTFCTLADCGNPQTLVWRKPEAGEVAPADPATLAAIDRMTYQDVFGSGIPGSFVPKSEAAAIAWALGDLPQAKTASGKAASAG